VASLPGTSFEESLLATAHLREILLWQVQTIYYIITFSYYTHQTSEQCLEIFRHNLLDIGIHPAPYGTHSFRRGGCQWLASVRRWNLRRICDWGGWSTEFSSLTIVKYLISWNDDPTETRDNFFNPDQAPTLLCYHCGRSCACA
jgi:hypothetical protein